MNALLLSTSILGQGKKIPTFFALTGSMDSLTINQHQTINTEKILRIIMSKYCDVYNVFYYDHASTIADENTTTMYI